MARIRALSNLMPNHSMQRIASKQAFARFLAPADRTR